MGQIDEVPAAVTGAGQSHDYPNPPVLASVVLVNIPLDPDHVNIGLNRSAYDTYIADEIAAGRSFSFTVNMLDPEHDLKIPLAYKDAVPYNYGRLLIGGRYWYVFYTAEYMNATSTRMVATLDEWPSFDNWSLGYSTIERGHVGVAVSQGDTYGDLYCTTPEPLEAPPVRGVYTDGALPNTLGDYSILVISANDLRGNGTATPFHQHHVNEANIGVASILASSATADHTGANQYTIPQANYPWLGTVGGGFPPTFNLYVPNVTPSQASTIDGIPAGGGAYVFSPSGWAEYVTIMQGAAWVMSGVVDIRVVPSWAVGGASSTGFAPRTPPEGPEDIAWGAAAGIPVYVAVVNSGSYTGTHLAGWRANLLAAYGASWYRKLLTSSYTAIALGTGTSLERYLPEQWHSDSVGVSAVTGAAHGEMSARVTPDYNLLGAQVGVEVPVGGHAGLTVAGYGRAAASAGSADMAPYQAAYTSFNNRHTLEQQKALAITLGVTGIQMSMGVQGIQSVINGVTDIANPSVGGALGSVAGVANYAVAGIAANNSIDLLDIAQEGSFDIATYQLGVSGAATVQAFDAWAQSLHGSSGSGTAESLSSAWRSLRGQALDIIIMAPSVERIYALLSMWRRYGYMVERAFTPSRLDVMTHFTYWKTRDVTLIGSAPQRHRQSMKAAFDRGVTIWTTVHEVGSDQTTANSPIAGSYY